MEYKDVDREEMLTRTDVSRVEILAYDKAGALIEKIVLDGDGKIVSRTIYANKKVSFDIPYLN